MAGIFSSIPSPVLGGISLLLYGFISVNGLKVLIENKRACHKDLLYCLDEDKQIHKYLKQEKCNEAFLVVFVDDEKQFDKINKLHEKASKLKEYKVNIIYIDCQPQKSASKL